MKYYLIAGEASGDLHASNLIKELKNIDQNAEFRFWGGDKMAFEVGQKPVKHISDLAFMGFVEVILNLKTILGNINFCKKDILAYKPDVLVLVDYPGFNLRIASFAKKMQLKVVYYIAPQVWAWKANRAVAIKENVHRLIAILPFEVDFFKKYNFDIDYVGHPLLDVVNDFSDEKDAKNEESPIALIPGSRKQEIKKMLPVMLKTASRFKYEKFVVTAAPAIDKSFYKTFEYPPNVRLEYGKTHKVMRKAKAALVTSGTATLETALFNTPEIVCYKGSAISVAIARKLIKVKYISLVNLIMDQELVVELIQEDFNVSRCTDELHKILQPKQAEKIKAAYGQLRKKLGNVGASKRAAEIVYLEASLL